MRSPDYRVGDHRRLYLLSQEGSEHGMTSFASWLNVALPEGSEDDLGGFSKGPVGLKNLIATTSIDFTICWVLLKVLNKNELILTCTRTHEVNIIIIPIVQMGNWRHGELRDFPKITQLKGGSIGFPT